MLTDKQIINHLKKQKAETDSLLWDNIGQIKQERQVLKDEPKVRYRTDRERLEAGDHICLNCRYWIDSKCTSKKFKENENLWTMECIAEHYKYWEER